MQTFGSLHAAHNEKKSVYKHIKCYERDLPDAHEILIQRTNKDRENGHHMANRRCAGRKSKTN